MTENFPSLSKHEILERHIKIELLKPKKKKKEIEVMHSFLGEHQLEWKYISYLDP